MAWQLTDEVARLCPRGLPLGERKVLDAIAAAARTVTRTCDLDRPELARLAGLSDSGLRAAVRRLRDRGVELRVPIPGRVGRDGRPLYAVPGFRTRWHLPPMAAAAEVLEEALRRDATRRAAEKAEQDQQAQRSQLPDAPLAVLPYPAEPVSDAPLAAGLATEQQFNAHLHSELLVRDELIEDLRRQLEAAAALTSAALNQIEALTSTNASRVVHNPAPAAPAGPAGKGVTGWREGGHDVSARGASDAPPSVVREVVPAGAAAREAHPPICGQPAVPSDSPAAPEPTWTDLIARLGKTPPRCLTHSDWPSRRRPPDCRDCAVLRRAHGAQLTELVRSEAHARRDCPRCDELGWDLTVSEGEPAARCPGAAHRPAAPPGARAGAGRPYRAPYLRATARSAAMARAPAARSPDDDGGNADTQPFGLSIIRPTSADRAS